MTVTAPAQDSKAVVYLAACNDRQLLIQRCNQCQHFQFYPRLFCTACGSSDLASVQSSGLGRIATYTLVRKAPAVASDQLPLAVALIDLDEGVRLMSNIVDFDAEQLHCGMRVSVKFIQQEDEQWRPVFTPAGPSEEIGDEQ